MRHDDQAQGIQTPARLIQAFHHLLTVAFNCAEFVITDVRVNGTQRFQTGEFSRQLLVRLFARRVDQRAGRFFYLRFTELQNGMHILLYGVEASRSETSRLRDRTQINANGGVSKLVAGEPFPQRNFPDSTSDRLGVFVQDEMRWDNGLSLTPGVRFDVEGSGYGFRVVRQLKPAEVEQPTTCQMNRP